MMSLIDILAPEWDKSCIEKNNVHHNDSGTKEHNQAVPVSQNVCINPIPFNEQDATQGQFLSRI